MPSLKHVIEIGEHDAINYRMLKCVNTELAVQYLEKLYFEGITRAGSRNFVFFLDSLSLFSSVSPDFSLLFVSLNFLKLVSMTSKVKGADKCSW